MGYVDEIINELDQLAVAEIMEHAVPTLDDYNDTVNLAVELGKKLNANLDVIRLGARLLEIKLGEAIHKKKKAHYVEMSSDFTKSFLVSYPLSEEFKKKVISCIEEQNENKFSCIEAEICANAMRCNYLTPKKIFKRFYNLHDRGYSFAEAFLLVDEKTEEKWKRLTLDVCKNNWKNNYDKIREFIELARHNPSDFAAEKKEPAN